MIRSLRSRLLLLVLGASVPLYGLIVYSAWNDRAAAAQEAQRQTRQLAQLIADEQFRLIEQSRQMLLLLSSVPVARDTAMLARCGETFSRIRQQNPMYGNLGMVDARGNVICSALPTKPGLNVADRSWFQRAVNSRGFSVGDYLVGRVSGLPSLTLSYPVLDEGGRVWRVLFAAVDLNWLQKFSLGVSLPPGSAVAIVDAQGTILVRYPELRKELQRVPLRPETDAIPTSGCRGYREMPGLDGVVRLNAIEPLQQVPGGCVYVRVGIPKSEIYAPINRRLQIELAAMVGVTLLMFALAWFGGDLLVLRRVHALTKTARHLGQGNLSARTGLPHGGEELGQLAQSFDEMAEGLQQREARLAAADRALSRANRALTVLSAGNHAMLRATDETSLLDEMCRMVVDKAGYALACAAYVDEEKASSLRLMTCAAAEGSHLEGLRIKWGEAGGMEAIAATTLNDGQPAVIHRDGEVSTSADGNALLSEFDLAACAVLPLRLNGTALGVLCIYADEEDAFDEGELSLLNEAAADLCFGIVKLRDQIRRREAEDANRIKSEFLANMSHELRTPLNAIIGFSEVMKDGLVGELTPEQQECVTDIFVSGRHLLSLINDILDLSKVEAGKMAVDLEPIQIAELLENSLSVVREKAAAHRIQLRCDCPDISDPVLADARKVKQIVYNLLSNAVKFTLDGGSVALSARRVHREEVEAWVADKRNAMRLPLPPGEWGEYLEINVEDTGIGISPEDAPRLFRPFSQLDSSLARRFEGTGLGLAMVMKMTELHGGTVAVASEPGRGSCFTVWLPWRPCELPTVQDKTATPVAIRSRTALVVEDNDAAADLIRLQLEAEGMRVVRAASGEEALQLMGRQWPSVIVLDILLPGMDGWDLLGRIKQVDSPWVGVPVVIISIVAETKKGFALGAAHVLQKPVSREDLSAAMHSLGLGAVQLSAPKVLVVDDDSSAVDLLCAYLRECGCRVVCAYGGRQGLELTRREHPDLLILDLIMPDVSGFDVVVALRGDEATRRIPIVVVTSKALSAEDRALLQGQVSLVLEKSAFDHRQFAAEVRHLVACGTGGMA